MKLLQSSKESLVFHLGKREKDILLAVLKRYPCIPSAHQPLSKSGKLPHPEANQRLLDEALAENRAGNKRQLRTFLADPRRLAENETGFRLSLSPSDLEWLLQILNDIRVGSWIILGSPEEKAEASLLNEKTAPHFWAMEMSGLFQMHLLEAMEGGRET